MLARHEQEKARNWWDGLSPDQRWQLGDDLVLGRFDWLEWGLPQRPSSAFLNEVDHQRLLWEALNG